jgi:uncharacterized protein (DUF849 family)
LELKRRQSRQLSLRLLNPPDCIFANPFKDIQFFLEAMNEAGTRPEMECFDTGHINNARPLIDLEILQPPYQFSLIMGVLGGIPASTKNLVQQVDQLPAGSHWQVIGIGQKQWKLAAAAVSMGGNVRVGLEDNLYLPNGELAKSNGELVAKAAELVRLVGGEVATIAEVREILQLGSASSSPSIVISTKGRNPCNIDNVVGWHRLEGFFAALKMTILKVR